MTKAIKMKQNLIKLNEFCKKNLEKNIHIIKNVRKRNTTIQDNPNLHTDTDMSEIPDALKRNMSKISQRTKKKKQIQEMNEERAEDSSKLSTEFYEEYFRLINSIKKEQKESSSKVVLSETDLSNSNFA